MSNEKMREEFVAWFYYDESLGKIFKDHDKSVKACNMSSADDAFEEIAWRAYQASRAALCVELPQQGVLHHTTTYNAPDVRSALDDAGVKYK